MYKGERDCSVLYIIKFSAMMPGGTMLYEYVLHLAAFGSSASKNELNVSK
jgi:hypothetical protein